MTWGDYSAHCQIAEEIGAELDKKVMALFGSYRVAGERLAELTGLSTITRIIAVRQYCHSGVSQISSKRHTKPRAETLQQLAVFYEMIGLEENDPIVQRTREINPAFQYTSHRSPSTECRVQVTVPAGYQLTAGQIGHLERLASMYATQNQER